MAPHPGTMTFLKHRENIEIKFGRSWPIAPLQFDFKFPSANAKSPSVPRARLHGDALAPTFRVEVNLALFCASAGARKPADTQVHKYTDTETQRYTDTQTHRYTDTPTH